MKKARQPRLFEVLMKRGGYRKTTTVLAFIVAWSIVEEELGRRPSVDEYQAYWRCSRRTAFREQELFRELVPEFDTPSELLIVMREQKAKSVHTMVLPAM